MEEIMQDIVKQVIQVDAMAHTTKKNNEEMLKYRKEQYEEQMKVYKEDILSKARQRATEVYNQVVESGSREYHLEEEKSKQITLLIQNRYLQAEKTLIDQIFNELFLMEE